MLTCPACTVCGGGVGPVCRRCALALTAAPPLPPPTGLDSCTAWWAYDEVARDVLLSLKNRQRRDLVGWLAEGLLAGRPVPPGAVVTWAPTAAARRRHRGFDHAELLARAVARRSDRPVRSLLRRRSGRAQAGLDRLARGRHPGFVAPAGVPRSVLVVDDVATSGATLAAAARALRDRGAVEVHALVVARAAGPARE